MIKVVFHFAAFFLNFIAHGTRHTAINSNLNKNKLQLNSTHPNFHTKHGLISFIEMKGDNEEKKFVVWRPQKIKERGGK